MTSRRKTVMTVLGTAAAGMVFASGFAPYSHSWAALLSFAFLIWTLQRLQTPRETALHAFVFGVASFSVGLSWTMNSIAVHGRLPWAVAALALLLLACVLSVFIAASGAVAKKLSGNGSEFPFLFSGLCLLSDWLRGGIVAHFGWLAPGYAWMDTPLLGWAPLGGIHAVSLSGLLLAALAVSLVNRGFSVRKGIPELLFSLVILLVGQVSLTRDWSEPSEGLEVALLQPDLPVVDAWTKVNPADRIEALYPAASDTKWSTDRPNLLLTPEGVVNQPIEYVDDRTAKALMELRRLVGAPVLFNAFRTSATGYLNTEFLLDEKGIAYSLDKRRLVPFGEFVPAGARWFVDLLGIPMADLEKGDDRQVMLNLSGVNVAFLICYENLYGELLRSNWASGLPDVLVVTANLGWFGRDIVPQHVDMSRMRAMEAARPLIYVGNTGMSSVIAADGEIERRLSDEGADYGTFPVRGANGKPTPYIVMGDAPALLLAGLTVILAILFRYRCSARKKLPYKEYN